MHDGLCSFLTVAAEGGASADAGLSVLLIAVVGGIVAQVIARSLSMPAIIPLLALGILVGPDVLGWMARPAEALPQTLPVIIKLGVALILFEGGLSLNLSQLRMAPKAVRNLLTIGVTISFVGGTLCAHYIAGFDWQVSWLYGALMIVTGPTVVVPLLKNLRLVPRVHTVLLWEGILIDAIGAVTAVVVFEVLAKEGDLWHAGSTFFNAIILGGLIGTVGGFVLARIMKWRFKKGYTDEELDHLLVLAGAFALYGAGETVAHEGGLAAVTCAGLVVSQILGAQVESLRRFKGTLTTLAVSMLFMVLAADFHLDTLKLLYPYGYLAIAGVMLLVRPLNVWVSTAGTALNWREKVFLGWIGPRGIVAASVASLFGLLLRERGSVTDIQNADLLVAITFSTIMATVVLNGLTARPLGWLLGLQAKRATGLLVVGVHSLSMTLASVFQKRGYPVLLIDTNPDKCERGRKAGFRAIQADALETNFLAEQDLAGVGAIAAITPSAPVNARTCLETSRALNLRSTYTFFSQSASPEERQFLRQAGVQVLFSEHIDLSALGLLMAPGPWKVREIKVPADDQWPAFPKPFLPLAVSNTEGLQPYVVTMKLEPGWEIVGVEVDIGAGDSVPFEPFNPHQPRQPSIMGMRQ